MCGRFYLDADFEEILKQMFPGLGLQSHFSKGDQSPGGTVGVLTGSTSWGVRHPRWGWQVPWSKRLLINGRSETLFEKTVFQEPLRSGRCVVPATGYYEGFGKGSARQRYSFNGKEGLFYMAGLLRPEPQVEEGALLILTRSARAPADAIHDRMPVILNHAMAQVYVHGSGSPEDLQSLFRESPYVPLEMGGQLGMFSLL